MKIMSRKKTLLPIALFTLLTIVLFAVLAVRVLHQNNDTVKPTQKIWGAYTGNSAESMRAFEQLVGSSMPIHVVFWGWDDVFPDTGVGPDGKTVLLYWEPSMGFRDIASGKHDDYIRQFAQGAKAYGYPIVLAPFPEFNLNESAWGNGIGGNTPELFVQSWKKVVTLFRDEGVNNVQYLLVYNNVTIPEGYAYADFYPGSEYVDIVGVDGFNFDTQSFSEVFDSALAQARQFNKPLWIPSTGSVWPQTEFIKDLASTGLPWIWFNEAPFDLKADAVDTFHFITPSFQASSSSNIP